jgi:quercetin dioxygenase-like cupin family protein
MTPTDLNAAARALPQAWSSTLIARFGTGRLKVLRMDGAPYPEETHDYPEGLLVLDGRMLLTIGSATATVGPGELYVVPPGIAHAVAPGSTGTLVILDEPPPPSP